MRRPVDQVRISLVITAADGELISMTAAAVINVQIGCCFQNISDTDSTDILDIGFGNHFDALRNFFLCQCRSCCCYDIFIQIILVQAVFFCSITAAAYGA